MTTRPKIFQGDDTQFNEGQLVVFKLTSSISLASFTGMFELGRFRTVQNLTDGTLVVNIPRYYTKQFPLGIMCGTFRLIDTEGRYATVSNSIEFEITNQPFTQETQTVPLTVPTDYPVNVDMQIGIQNGDYNVLNNKPSYPDGTPITGTFDLEKAGLNEAPALETLSTALQAESEARAAADTALQEAIDRLNFITFVAVLPTAGESKYIYAVPQEETDLDDHPIVVLYLWNASTSAWNAVGAFSTNLDPVSLLTKAEAADTYLAKTSAANTYLPLSQKAAAGGVASLDANGHIAEGQLPYAAINTVGGIKQSFDASTGTWTVITEDL